MGILTDRLNGPGHVLTTYRNMIRTLPLETVIELKTNLESEVEYTTNRHYQALQEEFNKRLNITNE